MYLYVEKREGLSKIPKALLLRFGQPKQVMSLMLRPEQMLARVDINTVINAINEFGFFLQMPSSKETYMLDFLPDYKF